MLERTHKFMVHYQNVSTHCPENRCNQNLGQCDGGEGLMKSKKTDLEGGIETDCRTWEETEKLS